MVTLLINQSPPFVWTGYMVVGLDYFEGDSMMKYPSIINSKSLWNYRHPSNMKADFLFKEVFSAGSNTKFDAASSYAQDFVAKELPRQAAFMPRAKPASGGKFEATTNYAVSPKFPSAKILDARDGTSSSKGFSILHGQ